jgi:hypothetical protein
MLYFFDLDQTMIKALSSTFKGGFQSTQKQAFAEPPGTRQKIVFALFGQQTNKRRFIYI